MQEFIVGIFKSETFSALHHAIIVGHVLTALLALLVAPVAMVVTKGGRTHILWGRIYFWAMISTNLLAFWLLYWRFNTLLFGIVVLTLYGSLTGYRASRRKMNPASWFDWTITMLGFTTGAVLILWGFITGLGDKSQYVPSSGNLNIIAVILPIIFGMAIVSDSWNDIRIYRNPSPDRRWWWYHHMERMLGSYIGLTTALMVQQAGPRLDGNWAWMAWVLPAAIGIPLVNMWINYYRRKFSASKQPTPPQPTLSGSESS